MQELPFYIAKIIAGIRIISHITCHKKEDINSNIARHHYKPDYTANHITAS